VDYCGSLSSSRFVMRVVTCMINYSHCPPFPPPHFLFLVFVVSLSFLSLPSHSLFFISGIIASDWSCDSRPCPYVSSVIWLYDLQETEWVWCDGNNPDSVCDWATEGCHMPPWFIEWKGKSLCAHWRQCLPVL